MVSLCVNVDWYSLGSHKIRFLAFILLDGSKYTIATLGMLMDVLRLAYTWLVTTDTEPTTQELPVAETKKGT